jgi:hypothetical protein
MAPDSESGHARIGGQVILSARAHNAIEAAWIGST